MPTGYAGGPLISLCMLLSRRTVLIFICVLSCTAALSQGACRLRLSGRVVNEAGEAVPGATVVLLPDSVHVVTDIQGRFTIGSLCAGAYQLVVQSLGLQGQQVDVTLTGDTDRVITLLAEVKELEEVVVEDKLLNVEHVQNYAVLSQKQLEESAGKPLGEALREIPGVNTIQAGPGIFKPVIHGVHSQRILILNHGIRQEGQQWGAEHAPEIDPFTASQIVVIKDASAIRYGTDALGGVVVVNPAPLPEEAGLGGSVNAVAQSNGRSGTLSGMLEGGIKNHHGWGWRVQGTAKRAGDYTAPHYQLTNTGVRELNFSGAAGYHKDKLGVDAFFSHFQTELGILRGTAITSGDDLENAMEREPPQYTAAFSYDISQPRQEVGHNLLKLNGHIDKAKGVWRFQYGFQNNSRREFDLRRGNLLNTPAIDLKLDTHTLEAEWETSKTDKRTTCIGMSGMLQHNDNIPGTQVIPFIPNYTNQSAGVFFINKLYLQRWTIDVGARYDYKHYYVSGRDYKNQLYQARSLFQNPSFTAGATLRMKREQMLNINVSSSWRPPHVAELYSMGTHQGVAMIEYGMLLNDSTNAVMNIHDTSVKSEQAVKLVTTYARSWDHVHVEASIYANSIFNYIYLRPTGVTQDIRGVFPYARYTQTDALFLGSDFSVVWKAGRHVTFTPKVSLIRASDVRHNDYLPYIPSNRYELVARYEALRRFWLKGFFAEVKVRYIDRQRRAPHVVTPRQILDAYAQNIDLFQNDSRNFDYMASPAAYTLASLATGFSYTGGKVRYDFRLSAENLLNTSYREYTNRFRYYADELGRNFIFSIHCVF